MWKMLELLYQVFKKDAFDYFLDLMPALHNYVTVDTPAFLSNESYVYAIFDMCKTVCTIEFRLPFKEKCLFSVSHIEIMR